MAEFAEGTIIFKSAEGGKLVFAPGGTSYELELVSAVPAQNGDAARGRISVRARKLWTIPAGGSFIQPLVGSPRVVQGRIVKLLEGNRLLVQAGTMIEVELPTEATAMDLKNGAARPGCMVNVTIFPGATFEAA